jgi:hypothetical protein
LNKESAKGSLLFSRAVIEFGLIVFSDLFILGLHGAPEDLNFARTRQEVNGFGL